MRVEEVNKPSEDIEVVISKSEEEVEAELRNAGALDYEDNPKPAEQR